MKALVKAKAERGIWMEDIDRPAVGHNDVLIKVNRTAICGTDIHIFNQWCYLGVAHDESELHQLNLFQDDDTMFELDIYKILIQYHLS